MQPWVMDDATTLTRSGITVRLDHQLRDRVQRIAAAEHRSVAGYVQMLIERDVTTREEAERVIHVFVASELRDAPLGTVGREDGETDEEYAQRAKALDTLFGAP
jgi:predicted transcriptional regulator